MCGIVGVIDLRNRVEEVLLRRMLATLSYRGPDDTGIFVGHFDGVSLGLGHSRLSVIDLSPLGHQPMHYKNLSIVFNGEIYNYEDIKEELLSYGHEFRSHSDTEVVLHSFEQWGVQSVDRFIGMFAFAIVDKHRRVLYLFRDRAGVKPLYYFNKNGLLIFASELKAFHQHPSFTREIDPASLHDYIDIGYIPNASSVFKNTYKVPPGHYLSFQLQTGELAVNAYWQAKDFYSKPRYSIGYEDAKGELEKILVSAFQYRLVSDVPVGIFLSGGYDSTAVASILQRNTSAKLKTFTIGFLEGNNEAPYAKKTADYLGTDHHEYYCTTKEAQELIPDLPFFYDEPFADSSAIPTMLVSRFARQHVTVALSADGGDELFGGYNRYSLLDEYLRKLEGIPSILVPPSRVVLWIASHLIPGPGEALKHKMDVVHRALNRNRGLQGKLLFELMKTLPRSYHRELFVEECFPSTDNLEDSASHTGNALEDAMLADFRNYLPDDILTKVDRATMSVSLEGRDPLVDHRIVEFVARLPLSYKFSNGSGKRILKEIVHNYVPEGMMRRRKAGFSIPLSSWLRGDLSYFVDEYLSRDAVATSGLFNVAFVLDKIDRFRQRRLHYTPFIWRMLMFQMWYDRWMN